MLLVQVANGIAPQQVDDFGPGVERSVKGALYFRPNTLRSMTKGEFDHIQQSHPQLAAKLKVVQDSEKKAEVKPASANGPIAFAAPVADEDAGRKKRPLR